MPHTTSLDDIIGIESIKLGFFKEAQETIQELKASNIELEQKRQDVQAILNGIPDAMAVVSLDYRILRVNDAFRTFYKVPEPEGLPCYRILRGRETPCTPCPLSMAKGGTCKVCRQVQIMNKDGENRQIESTASLMCDPQGAPKRVLLLLRDVTLEKQYQAKYLQAERMATIGVLAEGVAHEINNPLTSIGGFTEALKRRLGPLSACLLGNGDCSELLDNYREYLDIILKECGRCSEIVQNLLTFGHREIRTLSIISLNDVIENSLKLLRPRLTQLPANVVTFERGDREPCVLGHPGELMQVILNLVLNALYAVRDSGTITIRTSVEGSMVTLRVIDTGHGILPEHMDKLFDPFFTTKPAGQGIGIGLSTCYNIISKHGGDITVTSKPGKGATFEIILPYFDG